MLVALDRLPPDGFFERRLAAIHFEPVELGGIRPPALLSQFVTDAIENGLTQVRLQRPRAANLEVSESLERLKQRVLQHVVSVGAVARPFWQPAFGPTLQRREMTGEKAVDRSLISRMSALEQAEGGLAVASQSR